MNGNFCAKVSIIIPSYNNFESFKRVLNSVLSQKFQDWEVIITDDSDNDEIKNFLAKLEMPKIKYYKNETRLGSPENWNEGIRKANGEYIKILHHDDWLADANSLEKFVKLLDEKPLCDFGYAKSVNVDTETGEIKSRKAEKYVARLQKDPFELFLSNRIGAPSVAIFRNGKPLNKSLFFDTNLKWVVDIDFYLQCLTQNNNIAFLNEVLINIGISKTQITKTCQNDEKIRLFEQLYLYNKYKSRLQENKYQKSLISLVEDLNIRDLEQLESLLPQPMEIPEKIVKHFSKRKTWLKSLF